MRVVKMQIQVDNSGRQIYLHLGQFGVFIEQI